MHRALARGSMSENPVPVHITLVRSTHPIVNVLVHECALQMKFSSSCEIPESTC
jgi:hypothetical protein